MKASRLLIVGALLAFAPAIFAASGDYKEVACGTQTFFGSNTCNQCFDGGTLTPGQKLTGLYDSWTNKNATEQVIYQDEQMNPTLINLGGNGTSFVSNPLDEAKFWKFGSEIIFTPESSGSGSVKRNVFSLKPGKTVRVMDSEFGAYYQLEKTDAKKGAFVALVKFPVNYHDVSDQTGKAGLVQKHLECVAFSADVPAASVSTPVKIVPTPAQVTTVKTGAADTFLFVGLAMLLALAFMFARKRRS